MVSRFKLLLQHLNLSAAEFASRIGVQRSSMSHILSGRNKPSLDFMEKTLAAFPDINAGWLITGNGDWKIEIGNSGLKEGKIVAETATSETGMRSAYENVESEESDKADRHINKAPAFPAEGPVDHIIIVYKDNTFRILNPSGTNH
jgi:transcriptional regulator with XRE-family HTH domain